MADDSRRQLALELPASTSYRAEDFVVGACNRAAHDLVVRWPDWPHFAIGLHGPAGAGKTHLAQIWAARAKADVAGIERLRAAGPDAMAAANRRWVLELDSAGALADVDERSLFHLHNLVHASEGALVYISREPLVRRPTVLPDLRSRMAACPAAAVGAPDDAVLAAVMAKLAADRQIVLGEAVIAIAQQRMERSFAAVAAFVRALDARALADRRAIRPKLALAVLDEIAEAANNEVGEA